CVSWLPPTPFKRSPKNKKGKEYLYAQGKHQYGYKQSRYGSQTKPIFCKKVRTMMKIALRLEYVEPNCLSKGTLAIKWCKHFKF
uniref:60S ribosomal protein L36a n=1 Tax=Anolis carolinensis TaxID=28377 RepID=A0A803SMN6_ANOCA